MNYLIDKYIEADFNTEFLINCLKDDDYIARNKNEIEFRISELTYPQFLYVLNSVIESSYKKQLHEMTLSKENLEMFFEFIYDFNQRHLKHLQFKSYNDIHLKILGLKNYDDKTRIFVKQYDNRVKVLIKELIGKLSFKSKYVMKNEVVDVIYSYPENLIGRACEIPLIDFIINKLNEIRYHYEKGHYSFSNYLPDRSNQIKHIKIDSSYERELSYIYNQLKKYELINYDNTSLKDFIIVLTKDSNPDKSIIEFKMNNPETIYFFDLLGVFTEKKIELKEIASNGYIKNKNKDLKSGSFSSTKSQIKDGKLKVKRGKEIDEIFKNLK